MGPPAAGSVVLVPFPFSDLTNAKRRPAVVLADAGRGDWILCQVTSAAYADTRAIVLADVDFLRGGLRLISYVRPAKLFTAHESMFVAELGVLLDAAFHRIRNAVVAVIDGSP